jgi:hypothetical protein
MAFSSMQIFPSRRMTRAPHIAMRVVACLALAGCSLDALTGGSKGPITIVDGADVSDTIDARLLRALIVEVRVKGELQKGVEVRFNALPSTNALRPYELPILIAHLTDDLNYYNTIIVDSTDASGKARVLVRLGSVAGAAGIAISVPQIGVVDTATYTVRPGNATRIGMSVRDTAVIIGATYNLGGAVTDKHGNVRTEVPTFAPANPFVTVDAAGMVKTTSVGRALIVIKSGVFADTARVSVVPDATIVGVTANLGQRVLATAKLDGTGFLRLTSTVSNILLPRWNPTGTRVVFYEGDPSTNSQLYSVDLSGTRTLVSTGGGLRTRFFPTYSADGQQLFFTAYSSSDDMEIWRSQADGSGIAELVSLRGLSVSDPSVSADGTKLVFRLGARIATIDLGTKVLTTLAPNGRFPRYSPDGTQILFLTPDPSHDFNLAVMNADGSNVRVVEKRIYEVYSAPNWSPDGTWILVRGDYNLDLVRASNFEVVPVPKLDFSQASFKP